MKNYNVFNLENGYDGELYIRKDLTEIDKKIFEALLRLFKQKTEVECGDREHSKDVYQELQIADMYFVLRTKELRNLSYDELNKQLKESLEKIKNGFENINNVREIKLIKNINVTEDEKQEFDYYKEEFFTYKQTLYTIEYLWKWSYEELDNLRDYIVPDSSTQNKLKRLER